MKLRLCRVFALLLFAPLAAAAQTAQPLIATDIPIHLPAGEELGRVSWIASDAKHGLLWLIQRGPDAPPVIAVDSQGQVIHAFGRGLFVIPHAIRLDPAGNVWTVDAGNSRVIKWSPEGKELLRIEVGTPEGAVCKAFCGTTDVAFGPSGEVFISDGYGNACILVYSATGTKLREWGTPGTGPANFHLPHSIVIDPRGIVYVADRENGRIQKFDLEGKYLGQITGLGRVYSLVFGSAKVLWAGVAPLEKPTGAAGWLIKLDRHSGKELTRTPVGEGGLHAVAVNSAGEPMTVIGSRVLAFREH